MTRVFGRWAMPAGVLAVAAVAAAIAAPTIAGRAGDPATRETSGGGLIARIPFVGTLTWRCDERGRFHTQLTLPSPGATVFVGLSSDGGRVWRDRQVNPLPAPRRTVVGPFRALRRQSWNIRYHHKPATLRVVARLRFGASPSRAECVVSRTDIEIRRQSR